VKSFVSPQFLNLRQLVEHFGRGDDPVTRPLPIQDNTNTEQMLTDIHASSGIRAHDPSVQAGEDSSCFRSSGHRVPVSLKYPENKPWGSASKDSRVMNALYMYYETGVRM
jgi:hypothetical protein